MATSTLPVNSTPAGLEVLAQVQRIVFPHEQGQRGSASLMELTYCSSYAKVPLCATISLCPPSLQNANYPTASFLDN